MQSIVQLSLSKEIITVHHVDVLEWHALGHVFPLKQKFIFHVHSITDVFGSYYGPDTLVIQWT
jgi:hypothetical protein